MNNLEFGIGTNANLNKMNKQKYGVRSSGLGLSIITNQSSEEDLFRKFFPVPIEECISENQEEENKKPDSFK